MANYWLHVLRQESTEALIVAVSSFPEKDGLSVPTASHDSWAHLHAALLDAGITSSLLQDAEKNLDSEGFCTLTDVPLTHGQLLHLGFGNLAESLAA